MKRMDFVIIKIMNYYIFLLSQDDTNSKSLARSAAFGVGMYTASCMLYGMMVNWKGKKLKTFAPILFPVI